MKNKILSIVVFAVAILDCLLALFFSFSFNEEKKDNYIQARTVQEQCPALIADLQSATPESLPKVVETYQTSLRTFNDTLKAAQMQKDILYTYLQELKNLDENSFEAYKSGFAGHADALFARADNKDALVEGFNKVNSFKELASYISKTEKDYNVVKQDYLVNRNYLKAANGLVGRADMINANASANKKATDLEELQNDLKSFNKSTRLENAFVIIGYILGGITLFLMVFFALVKIVKNFKTSYKILLVLVAMAVVVFIGYIIGSSVLSPSAIKAGLTVTGFKMVNAACFTFYVCLAVSILAILGTSVMSAIKNRK